MMTDNKKKDVKEVQNVPDVPMGNTSAPTEDFKTAAQLLKEQLDSQPVAPATVTPLPPLPVITVTVEAQYMRSKFCPMRINLSYPLQLEADADANIKGLEGTINLMHSVLHTHILAKEKEFGEKPEARFMLPEAPIAKPAQPAPQPAAPTLTPVQAAIQQVLQQLHAQGATGATLEELEKLVKSKRGKVGNLITDMAALNLVKKELGLEPTVPLTVDQQAIRAEAKKAVKQSNGSKKNTCICKYCQQPIYWFKTEEGKAFPCNSGNREDKHNCRS